MMERIPTQPSNIGPADWFTGVVWYDVVVPQDGRAQGRCNVVRFSPGSRSAWHKHVNGQTLYIVDGIGLTQVRDGEVIVMKPGDTLWCPPDTWHWHGASPEYFLTHLAMWDGLRVDQEGPETTWGALVSDADYSREPRS
jgi:quercetin dioxygenase-like cupin family protein